ncbi:MAG: DNA polymerase III subunit beta [Pirellulales bacterium]
MPQRSPKPILANVRLGDGLLTGTDLEVRIDRVIDYHGDPLLLPAHRLSAILRAATGDDVTLTPKGASVTVKCGRGSWTLPTEDAAEYPTWEAADLKAVCRLPADQFSRAAKATVYAADTESSRFALGAVLLEVAGGNPTWVATDGRRLSTVETETDQAVDDSTTLIPARVISTVMAMAHGDGSVQIESNGKEVRFSMDECTVTGRIVEGRYPRWRDVLGEMEGEPTVIAVAELLSAVASAAIVTSEQSKGITLAWGGDKLTLTAKSSEYGESRVTCGVEKAGTTSGTKLDPRYLSQFLAHIPSDEEPHVDVYATDASSRVLVKCGPYTGVIMPLAEDA